MDEQIFPASMIQRQFWVLHRRDPLSPAYQIPSISIIEGDLDIPALEAAVNTVLRRHRVFRATFDLESSGMLVHRISAWRWMALPQVDLRTPSDTRPGDAIVEEAVIREFQRPFDLGSEPPVRFKLFRIGERTFWFVLTAHHIVFDLATKDMVAEEIAEEYRNARAGRTPSGYEEHQDYAVFSAWEDHWLRSEEGVKTGEDWKKYLQGADPSLDFPTDRGVSEGSPRTGTIVPVRIPREMIEPIRRFCRESAATPFLVLLTAWALTLARWSGQTKLCLGVPLTNRRKEQFKRTMGCFVNILPLVFDISDSPTLGDSMLRVRRSLLRMHRIQEMPYFRLVQLVRQTVISGGNPLFQAGFTFEHPMRLTLEGVEVKPKYFHHGGAQLDLFATFWEDLDEIDGVIEYDSGKFDSATVERLGESFWTAVGEICLDASKPVIEATLVPAKDLDLIVRSWNATEAAFDKTATVQSLIEAQTRRTPHAPAVRFEQEELTYERLLGRARSLSRHLRALGVQPEEPVGVCPERNLDIVPVLLGVLMAGGAYVPLDPAFPSGRLCGMIADAGVRFIVGSPDFRSLLGSSAEHYVEVDHDGWERFDKAPEEGLSPASGSLAYIMYTSGSSGTPKGVEIPQRAVVNFLLSMRQRPGLESTDLLLSVTTISFDISVLEIFLPLICGACTLIAPADTTFDGERLRDLLKRAAPTIMQATPATWRLLIASGWEGDPNFKALCGGEALSPDLSKELLRRCGEVWNMYGPTETTVWSTCQKCSLNQSRISIGRPINNTVVYVLDNERRPVPIGVWGELHIGGAGVARGYHNQGTLTAERFGSDPLTQGGGRLYRTGDRGRFLGDGTLECGGRLDRQIKIRGFRIEPGDIESILNGHPLVKEGAVDSRDDARNHRRLIAWIVPREGTAFEASKLRADLRKWLPDYMIPQIFIPIAALPMTLNNKLDRGRLPDPPDPSPDSRAAPSMPTEPGSTAVGEIRALWERLLGHSDFGNDDRFFEAGGDSLLAVHLRDHLASLWKSDIPVSLVFQYPTIRGLAAFHDQGISLGAGGATAGSERGRKQAAAMARRR